MKSTSPFLTAGDRDVPQASDPNETFIAEQLSALLPMEAADRKLLRRLTLQLLMAHRQGSTRLRIGDPLGHDETTAPTSTENPPNSIHKRLRSAPLEYLVGDPGQRKPLIADGGFLYAQRDHWLEAQVCALVTQRLQLNDTTKNNSEKEAELRAELSALLQASNNERGLSLSPDQTKGVIQASTQALSLISGGPGTGKTFLVTTLLRLEARRKGFAPEHIAIAAPTGKAADRLNRSIEKGLQQLASPSEADNVLLDRGPRAQTLHRLLGYQHHTDRFRHNPKEPLPHGLVIVDEASMIDLEMSFHLLMALSRGSRLLLLGDGHQLPSVGKGQVFADLCDSLHGQSTQLKESYRLSQEREDGRHILSVTSALRRGESPPLGTQASAGSGAAPPLGEIGLIRAAPKAARFPEGIQLWQAGAMEERRQALRWWYDAQWLHDKQPLDLLTHGWTGDSGNIVPEDSDALRRLFDHSESAQILAATWYSGGLLGVHSINQQIQHWLHDDLLGRAQRKQRDSGPYSLGDRIMVRRNDYRNRLFNGDLGLCLSVQDTGAAAKTMAVFRRNDGFFYVDLESIAANLDLGFATTIHRSQGSEFSRLLLVLPEDAEQPILHRPLLYTALTRARHSAIIVGESAPLFASFQRRAQRECGLRDRLNQGELGPRNDQRGA